MVHVTMMKLIVNHRHPTHHCYYHQPYDHPQHHNQYHNCHRHPQHHHHPHPQHHHDHQLYTRNLSGLPFFDVLLLTHLPKSAGLPVATSQETKKRILSGESSSS